MARRPCYLRHLTLDTGEILDEPISLRGTGPSVEMVRAAIPAAVRGGVAVRLKYGGTEYTMEAISGPVRSLRARITEDSGRRTMVYVAPISRASALLWRGLGLEASDRPPAPWCATTRAEMSGIAQCIGMAWML